MKLVLASTSKIRRHLLHNAGVKVILASPLVDEYELLAQNPTWEVSSIASNLAAAKALSVSNDAAGTTVIGADQILIFNGKQIRKPSTIAEARKQLIALRGSEHQLRTAICCASEDKIIWHHVSDAKLQMRPFSDEFLDAYLDQIGTDALTSVGAYKLESLGIQLFETIAGDYFTILGLPLIPLLAFLRSQGHLPT
jgi:septum formation protein